MTQWFPALSPQKQERSQQPWNTIDKHKTAGKKHKNLNTEMPLWASYSMHFKCIFPMDSQEFPATNLCHLLPDLHRYMFITDIMPIMQVESQRMGEGMHGGFMGWWVNDGLRGQFLGM